MPEHFVNRIAVGSYQDEVRHPSAIKAFVAEFISTLIFVFAGQGSGMAFTKLTDGGATTPAGLVAASLAHAFGLFVAVSVGANISGGHVNPAVTFGAFVGGNITLLRGIFYIIAQLLGSVVTCFFYRWNEPTSMSQSSSNDLSIQIANLLKNSLNLQNQTQKQNLSDSLKINLKLNSQNYALWARMIRVVIGGKAKALLSHLSQKPPDPTDEKSGYEQWEQEDLVVFSWLIQNIEPSLASNLTEFPTAKALWDALVVTYSSGKDKLQTFDLHVKANEFKQNGVPLEEFWIMMQGIWGEIERRDPNPMKCAADIETYNKIRSEQKLFQFLNALDRQYDPIRREILRWDTLPSAEGAYAAVRKETAHQNILGAISNSSSQQGVASGLAATELIEANGKGFVSKGQRRSDQGGKPIGSSFRVDKSRLKCSHCGMTKHTKEQCFKLAGFPEWWNDGHKKGHKEGSKTAAAVGNSGATGNDGDLSGGFGGMAAGGANLGHTSEYNDGGHQDGSDYWTWH